MPISISVKSDVKKCIAGLDKTQKKQVPFATARALTWTAQDAQKQIMDDIPKHFNVTKKWWLKQQPTGIKIKPALKTFLNARVYTNAYFAARQEEGGIKKPFKSRNLLVPLQRVAKSRRKSGDAKKMLAGKRVFSTPKGIFRRKGGKKNSTVELLYWRTPKARIKPRFEFRETAKNVAQRKFKRNMERSLEKALKTAK